MDESLDDVGVDTGEVALLELLLQCLDGGHVELAVEQQHTVALVLCSLDVRILLLLVGGIEIDELVVLIFLVGLDKGLVFVEGEVLAFSVLHQGEVLGTVIEPFLGENTIVDEEFQVVPLLLVLFAVLLEDAVQTIGHLLGDIG